MLTEFLNNEASIRGHAYVNIFPSGHIHKYHICVFVLFNNEY